MTHRLTQLPARLVACAALSFGSATLAGLPALAQDATAAASQAAGTDAASPGGGVIKPARMMPLAARKLILDAARAGDRLVAVGDRGHILLSDDNGTTWRQVSVPADSALTAVTFVDDSHGWAVGHDSVVLATADGGESWTLQHADPEIQQPLMDVVFTDRMSGIAVGAYSKYLETTDGGATWTSRRIVESEDGYDYHFNAILAPDATTRFIAGEAGTMAVSRDSGATWSMVESPYAGSFFDALVLSPQSWLAFGLQGAVFRSDDGGQSWTGVESGTTAGLMGGEAMPDGRVILVGAQGTILTSRDGGRSFTREQRDDRVALADAAAAADGSLILLGEEGALPPIR
ncbi:MAG: hypothetical protein RLY86_3148 [Pseudomonadota bacterium]|jgi:photosystem II stability/assembly factor-like uncharacterized protein